MKSTLLTAIALSVAVVATPLAQRETRERHVFISVTDKGGTPVPTLAPADVTIREDGVSREVLKISPAAPPSHIALLVDDGASSEQLIPDLRIGLSTFMKVIDGMSPVPSVGLTTFGDRPTKVVDFSSSTMPVTSAIGKLFARPNAGSHLLDALVETAAGLRRAKAERPVIVAFVAEDNPEFSNITHDRVADALKAAKVSLWTVVLQSRNSALNSSEARERAQVVGDITRDSGGQTKVILNKQGIDTAMKAVAAALSAQLDVTYARPEMLVPPTKIDVEVKKPDTRVTAPRWAWQ